MNRADRRRGGFTLLEVMVAVAILGITLTAIFASESGAVRASVRAQHYHVSTLLARCKMGEIEEKLMREGLPAIEAHGTDACCEDAEIEGYECRWTVRQVKLPANASQSQGGGGRSGGSGGSDRNVAGEAAGRVGTAGDFLAGGGDRSGLESMLIDIAVPVLTPAIEAQVRRIDVVVAWHEGESERTIDVSQFYVNENQANAEIQANGGR